MKRMLVILLAIMILFVGCTAKSTPAPAAPSTPAPDASDAPTPSAPAPADPVKSYELVFSTWVPPTNIAVNLCWEPWEKLVSEKTNGAITIKSVHGSQLGTILSGVQDLSKNLYDLAVISPVVIPDSEFYPYTISSLPFGCTDPETSAKVLNDFYAKYQDIKGVTTLSMSATDPYVIVSKKPIRSIEDVKGMKIRGSSQSDIALIKSWGATPVSMVLTEQYEALQKGTLDATLFALSSVTAFNLQDVCKYIVEMPMFVYPQVLAMSNDTYNKLPADGQKELKDDLGPAFGQLFSDYYASANTTAVEALKKAGVEFITLTPDQMKPFTAGVSAIWDTWAADADKKGYNGDQMVKDFIDILKANGVTPPVS